MSDALATAFYIGGSEVAERYCAANTDVLAIMFEKDAERPVIVGSNCGCRIEQIYERARMNFYEFN